METSPFFLAQMLKSGDRVETLIVLIGVLLGLSIGKFVTGVGQMLVARAKVTFSFSYVLFLTALFIYQVYYWWSVWDLQDVDSIGFIAYLRLLLIPLFLYCATAIMMPDFSKGEGFDMSQHFYDHSRVFFTIVTALVITGISQGYFFWEHRGIQIWIRFAALAVVAPGMFLRFKKLNLITGLLLLVVAGVFIYSVILDIQTMEDVPVPLVP